MRSSARRAATAVAVSAGLAAAVLPLTTAQAATVAGRVRTDQVGYANHDAKIAYLMAGQAVSGEGYRVLDARGRTVAEGRVGKLSRGSWNAAYPAVYPIDFSQVTRDGRYRIVVSGPVRADSPSFAVESAKALYGTLVADGVNFYQNQRDGAHVLKGALDRKPSHLNDARATVYRLPHFDTSSDNGDIIKDAALSKVPGAAPVDVSGGWFDAGDYLKFTFTTAYADSLLQASARALGPDAPASLTAEARFGDDWLSKMWNPATKTLYLQVGIGSGNAKGTFFGDHDLWRLPQVDDGDKAPADRYAARNRPVFRAAAPGEKISPAIVGRVAAAFALAAQNDAAAGRTARARTELAAATSLYAMADTHPTGPLVSAAPSSYYPETIWHDAMELAASEIVLAEQGLGRPRAAYRPYLVQAATWARDYLRADAGKDSLNLYDVSALAHADLLAALRRAGDRAGAGLAVSRADLVGDLRAQVAKAAKTSSADIFRAGGSYTTFDVDSHSFGFISTEALYRKATGDRGYQAFAAEQRAWLLGGNAWGTSFMIGAGAVFPHCTGSQIPNLSGSLNGRGPVDVGAVVNGPNSAEIFAGGLGDLQAGTRTCENDAFTAFDGHGSEYVDDVRSWQTSEEALDMTGSAILAGALQASAR